MRLVFSDKRCPLWPLGIDKSEKPLEIVGFARHHQTQLLSSRVLYAQLDKGQNSQQCG